MIVQLVMGDYSNDGHNITETVLCRLIVEPFPYPPDGFNLRKHYKEAAAKIGLDITEYCQDYEDNHLDSDAAKILLDKFDLEFPDGLSSEDFSGIYILIFNSLNPSIRLERIEGVHYNQIGGYGLFS
jgi:hypothetical protein